MANLFELPRALWTNSSGNPLAGGKLNFYAAGTSTRLDTYSDNALTSANANPVVANAGGYWGPIYLKAQSYKVVLTDASDVEIWSQDNVHGQVSVTGTSIILHVATIADMTAISKSELTANQQVHVGGYAAIGDGGGGVFYWHAGSSTTADEGTVFASDEGGTGRWKRIFSGAVNVRWFGAKGDNSTDDTDAIQNAVDYVFTNNLGEVFIPAGTYLVTTIALTWSASNRTVNIVGAGKRSTVIGKSGAGTDPLFDWDGGAALDVMTSFRDFRIAGSGNTYHGISLTDISRFTVENVDIHGCDDGLHCNDALNWYAYNCYFTGNTNGVLTTSDEAIGANHIELKNCQFQSNTDFGCDIGKAIHFTMSFCDFHNNGTSADTTTGAVVFRNTNDDLIGETIACVKDCWFEVNDGWALTVEDMTFSVFSMANCVFISNEDGQSCRISGGRQVTISGCSAVGSSETLEVAADNFTMISSFFGVITDTSTNTFSIGSESSSGFPQKNVNNYDSGDNSFTPVLEGTTAAGSGTYSVQLGEYTRIGNNVWFTVNLTWTNHTGTGNIQINLNDIPFTAESNSGVAWPCAVSASNLTFTGQLVAAVNTNSKIVSIAGIATGAAAADVAMDTAGSIFVSGRYRIANA